MDAKKLEAIKSYLSHNGVEYYDVQLELVDHFATAVEKQQRLHPQLSFTDALLKAHQSFGGREGFRKFIEAAETRVTKKTMKLVGLTFLRFLSWPYFILTLAITGLWFQLTNAHLLASRFYFYAILLGMIAIAIRNTFVLKDTDSFLAKKTSRSLGWITYLIIYIPGGNLYLFHADAFSPTYATIYFTILTITMVAFWRIPKLAIEEAKKIYPKTA